MTFEENFPSLKDYFNNPVNRCCDYDWGHTLLQIQQYCLDKKKVRESINDLKKMMIRETDPCGDKFIWIKISKTNWKYFEKELGL